MMPNKERMALVRAKGVCFLCSTCKCWYEGEDLGLKDDMGEEVCSKPDCAGPVWGKSFPEYVGILEQYKYKFGYLCGNDSTHYVWSNGHEGEKIGLCKEHVPTVKEFTARQHEPGYRALVVAEHIAAPDKHEVGQ